MEGKVCFFHHFSTWPVWHWCSANVLLIYKDTSFGHELDDQHSTGMLSHYLMEFCVCPHGQFFIAPKLTELDHYCIARGVSAVSPSMDRRRKLQHWGENCLCLSQQTSFMLLHSNWSIMDTKYINKSSFNSGWAELKMYISMVCQQIP